MDVCVYLIFILLTGPPTSRHFPGLRRGKGFEVCRKSSRNWISEFDEKIESCQSCHHSAKRKTASLIRHISLIRRIGQIMFAIY
jgi:hypothetical protein